MAKKLLLQIVELIKVSSPFIFEENGAASSKKKQTYWMNRSDTLTPWVDLATAGSSGVGGKIRLVSAFSEE